MVDGITLLKINSKAKHCLAPPKSNRKVAQVAGLCVKDKFPAPLLKTLGDLTYDTRYVKPRTLHVKFLQSKPFTRGQRMYANVHFLNKLKINQLIISELKTGYQFWHG